MPGPRDDRHSWTRDIVTGLFAGAVVGAAIWLAWTIVHDWLT